MTLRFVEARGKDLSRPKPGLINGAGNLFSGTNADKGIHCTMANRLAQTLRCFFHSSIFLVLATVARATDGFTFPGRN